MLVLSRKEDEKVLFPHLGISISILRVGNGKARLGIEAPGDVTVVRREIASDEQLAEFSERLVLSASAANHEMRNKLHSALLGLSLVHKLLTRNLIDEAEEALVELIGGLDMLDGAKKSTPLPVDFGSRRRALVVEDNSNERELLAGYLSLSGFEVESVDDGVKALDYLASHERPDAVVMDMQLPRLGGADAVGVLRSDPKFAGLKVYAVSGMDRQQARIPVGPQGVNYWFTKPLNPNELVQRILAEAH